MIVAPLHLLDPLNAIAELAPSRIRETVVAHG